MGPVPLAWRAISEEHALFSPNGNTFTLSPAAIGAVQIAGSNKRFAESGLLDPSSHTFSSLRLSQLKGRQ
jgi:hypothetical protein